VPPAAAAVLWAGSWLVYCVEARQQRCIPQPASPTATYALVQLCAAVAGATATVIAAADALLFPLCRCETSLPTKSGKTRCTWRCLCWHCLMSRGARCVQHQTALHAWETKHQQGGALVILCRASVTASMHKCSFSKGVANRAVQALLLTYVEHLRACMVDTPALSRCWFVACSAAGCAATPTAAHDCRPAAAALRGSPSCCWWRAGIAMTADCPILHLMCLRDLTGTVVNICG
jgi:hypothetical protein